jgi:hypothetical protein
LWLIAPAPCSHDVAEEQEPVEGRGFLLLLGPTGCIAFRADIADGCARMCKVSSTVYLSPVALSFDVDRPRSVKRQFSHIRHFQAAIVPN